MDEKSVEAFWQAHPCGDVQVGGLTQGFAGDYDAFFTGYDRFRYETERHLPSCIAGLNVEGKRVLEIGLGEGSDSEQLIRQGAQWSGIDLTAESISRVGTRLALRQLPYDELRQGTVLELPFPDKSFDLVFSHGVLHHVPDIKRAQEEIHRVLRPDGELVIMMYARWSLNYVISIGILRRAALIVAFPLMQLGFLKRRHASALLLSHLENANRIGLGRYLKLSEFVHHNTDGPLNPYALVYDRRRLERHFPSFTITRTYKRFMHAPPLPVHHLPGQAMLGWHLWAHLTPIRAQPGGSVVAH